MAHKVMMAITKTLEAKLQSNVYPLKKKKKKAKGKESKDFKGKSIPIVTWKANFTEVAKYLGDDLHCSLLA